MLFIETEAKDYTREQKRDILDMFRDILSKINRLSDGVQSNETKVTGDDLTSLLMRTLSQGERCGIASAYLVVADAMDEVEAELYPDRVKKS